MMVIDDFLAIANKEVGYTETGVNLTKYNDWADTELIWFTKVHGLAWCATFVAWCIFQLSKYLWSEETFCLDDKCCWSDHWMDNFKKAGRLFHAPNIGDFAFRNGHVGIVEIVNSKSMFVTTIEGNSHNSVEKHTYPWNYWLGFGRPNWNDLYISPLRISETTSAKEFVINQGIYIGREDGEMHWEDDLTREEMAIVLYRIWRKFLKDR